MPRVDCAAAPALALDACPELCDSACGEGAFCRCGSGECACEPGRSGPDCTTEDVACVRGQPVGRFLGGGRVVPERACACEPGWSGDRCEVNACAGVDCGGHGRCVSAAGGYECLCNPGYLGRGCQHTCLGVCAGAYPHGCATHVDFGYCDLGGACFYRKEDPPPGYDWCQYIGDFDDGDAPPVTPEPSKSPTPRPSPQPSSREPTPRPVFAAAPAPTSGTAPVTLFGVNYATGLMSNENRPDTYEEKLMYARVAASRGLVRVKLWNFRADLLDALGTAYQEAGLLDQLDVMIHVNNGRVKRAAEDPAYALEIIAAVSPYDFVKSIAVGNELDFPHGAPPAGALLEALEALPRALENLQGFGLRVTSPFSNAIMVPRNGDWSDVIVRPERAEVVRAALEHSDFYMFNPYPIFAYTTNQDQAWQNWCLGNDATLAYGSKSMLESQLYNMRHALEDLGWGSIAMAVGETGWASGGASYGTIANSAAFYANTLADLQSAGWQDAYNLEPGNFYLFELFDEEAKPGNGLEQNFGLLREDGSAKPGLTEVVLGDVVAPPCSTATVIVRVALAGAPYPNDQYSSVLVSGTFNDWGFGQEMAAVGDFFEAALEVAPGSSHEYVFTVTGPADSWSGWGETSKATQGGACDWNPSDAWPNFGFEAGSCGSSTTLETYVWGQGCLTADDATPRPTTRPPTPEPTPRPSTGEPSPRPTAEPSTAPPTFRPTPKPSTREPSLRPTPAPTFEPTPLPSRRPTPKPSTREPSPRPTPAPTGRPTPKPTTREPTPRPSEPTCASRVTIRIAMRNSGLPSASYLSILAAGSWNSWGFGAELSDADGDGIYSTTLDVAPGSTHERGAAFASPRRASEGRDTSTRVEGP